MKKTAIVIFIILLAVAGSLYWLWRQATFLPEWYTGEGTASDGTVIIYGKGIEDIRNSLEQTIEDQLQSAPIRNLEVTVTLNEKDANKLFATLISENAEAYPYLQAVKASKTRIRDGSLDFGVVVNASELLKEAPQQGTEVAAASDLLQGKEVSLGFTGKLGMQEGHLQMDDDSTIRIGGLTFSLKTITDRLGISEDQLKKTLKDIELGKLKIDTIRPSRNALLLKGAVAPR